MNGPLKKQTDNHYIDQLTWLRGIAAFFVIVSHTVHATEVKYSSDDQISHWFIMSLSDLGSFGVVLFFVLSGCTLYISNSDKVGYRNLAVFYTKRFFRIWPAFVVSLAIYIGFSFAFSLIYAEPQGHWIENQFLLQYSIFDIFSYLSFIFNIIGPSGIFNNAYWSLPVEFQYYIIFPVIVASLRYGVLGPVCLGLAFYWIPSLEFFDFDSNTVFTLAFSFCGGVLVGYLYKTVSFKINSIVGIFCLIGFVYISSAIGNYSVMLPNIPIISNRWNWYGVIAIATVFVSLVTKINIHNKFKAFLGHYGTISYSTYLYHNLFIAIAVLFLINFEVHNGNLRLLITLFFTLITSYIVATASYKYIEKPSITMGRYIIKKYN